MKWNRGVTAGPGMDFPKASALLTLALTLFVVGGTSALAQVSDSRPAELKAAPETYQTLYLTSLTQPRDGNDIVTSIRNMLPNTRVFYVPSQNAISMRGTPDEIKLAQKIVSEIDRTKKVYRLTYTITETDGGKPMQVQHFSLVVATGEKSVFKQGIKVPIVTGASGDPTPAPSTQVQYLDVGLNLEASLGGNSDRLNLRTKVEQSSVSEEKSGVGTQDPIVRQTFLETTAALLPGKPLIVGSLDLPGSTRREQIEVVSEPVQ